MKLPSKTEYDKKGFVRVEKVFDEYEVESLSSEMIKIINEWGNETIGWSGPWRKEYLSNDEIDNTRAVLLQNPHYYSAEWGKVLFHENMIKCIQTLIPETIQWHHTVLHAKPPSLGTPFPMHQDYPFYPHEGQDYIDCLLHLDDTPFESGCLQVVPESHLEGPIKHITGKDTAPYLPIDKYHPDIIETESIPCNKGDVIFFNYNLIHWSDCNRTNEWRKSVRFGFHSIDLRPVGKTINDTYNNIVVSGFRNKKE